MSMKPLKKLSERTHLEHEIEILRSRTKIVAVAATLLFLPMVLSIGIWLSQERSFHDALTRFTRLKDISEDYAKACEGSAQAIVTHRNEVVNCTDVREFSHVPRSYLRQYTESHISHTWFWFAVAMITPLCFILCATATFVFAIRLTKVTNHLRLLSESSVPYERTLTSKVSLNKFIHVHPPTQELFDSWARDPVLAEFVVTKHSDLIDVELNNDNDSHQKKQV